MQKVVFLEIRQIYSSTSTSILSFWTFIFTYYFCGLNNFEFAYPVFIRLFLVFHSKKSYLSILSPHYPSIQVWTAL